ncbi:hypothetical protein PIB30_009924 [Stylosanthes scabra]|uniref:Uncharacterized protein n=1 Tax=Stylosanthes scabra TaxID=79078 RepID=A0ABU6S5R3_9FABA|nr:hypothetical protein [Stylosanthes scabra]
MSDVFEDSEIDEQYEDDNMNEHIEENIYAHRDEQHHFLYEEYLTNEQIEPEKDCEDMDEQHEFTEDCGLVESSEDKLFSEAQQSKNAFDDAYSRRTGLCCFKRSENIGVDRILDDPRLVLEDFRRSHSTYG